MLNILICLIPERKKGLIKPRVMHKYNVYIAKLDIVLTATCISLEITSKHPSKLFSLIIKFLLLLLLYFGKTVQNICFSAKKKCLKEFQSINIYSVKLTSRH